MPRGSPPRDGRDLEAKIRLLLNDLFLAREAIIDLMPEHLRDCLEESISCHSFEDFENWESWAVDRVIAIAELDAHQLALRGRIRLPCPLCGGAPQSEDLGGYLLPTGLLRHLEGSHRSTRCRVLTSVANECRQRVLDAPDRPRISGRSASAWTAPEPIMAKPSRPEDDGRGRATILVLPKRQP